MSLKNLNRKFSVLLNISKSSIFNNNCCLLRNSPQCLKVANNAFRSYSNTTTQSLKHSSSSNKSDGDVKEVYYGILTPQIKAVKIFSLSSSIVGIIAQPFLYNEIVTTGNVPVIVSTYAVIGFFTVVTPILLHLITRKYVTHLEYNESTDTYTAKTVNFFCFTKKTEFKPDEVDVPDVPGMFTTIRAKGRALFVDPKFFNNPDHYAKIMGYDKPMDFKLSESPSSHDHNDHSKKSS